MEIKNILEELEKKKVLHLLDCGRRGIEKEGLRYSSADTLATTPHPQRFGSPLTHKEITTDYAESLLELVTPAFRNRRDALTHLRFLHRVLANQGDEYILNGSMPAALDDPEAVAIGWYGNSHAGQMRRLYRKGLALRYGKGMQLIAGMHFNYSICPDIFRCYADILDKTFDQQFINDHYMNLVRNIRRYAWLIHYLFGHSPAVDASFFAGKPHQLEKLDASTLYLPYATSLRMSDIGYHNKTPIIISANTLEGYIDDLRRATLEPHPAYQRLGLYDKSGKQQQISVNMMQIENEYYGVARPKQVPLRGEPTLTGLARRGVAYVELRALDINCFDWAGISQMQMDFLEIFMLYCLFSEAPAVDNEEERAIQQNSVAAASRGREPGLMLTNIGVANGGSDSSYEQISLVDWGDKVLQQMRPIAEAMDREKFRPHYLSIVERQLELIHNDQLTPSARILRRLRGEDGESAMSYHRFITDLSRKHTEKSRRKGLTPAEKAKVAADAKRSWEEEQVLVAQSAESDFSCYLQNYFAQIKSVK